MLAGVLLRLACGAFARLMRCVLVWRELAGPSARSLTCVLLRLDRGALVRLMGRVLIGLEGSGTGARTRRGCSQLGVRPIVGRGGDQGTEDGRADHAAGDHRSGDPGNGHDSLNWRQAISSPPTPVWAGNLSKGLQAGAPGNGIQDPNSPRMPALACRPQHRVADPFEVTVGD